MANVIYSINGPVIKLRDTKDFSMLEMVYVGQQKIIGEVISITDQETTIQVYESTTGLKPGEPVYSTGSPLCVTLGPGILSNIFDGIERPLRDMAEKDGAFIGVGSDIPALNLKKRYDVTMTVKVGDHLSGGAVYATCPETALITHKCMLSPTLEGDVVKVAPNGSYTVNDVVVTIQDADGATHELTLCQQWPIRTPRPVKERLPIHRPLITGQRIIDAMFPIA